MATLVLVPEPRLYRSRLSGPVMLVCGKCERKMKDDGRPLKVKKLLKRAARQQGLEFPIAAVKVGCMKLCPKHGVAVCPPSQTGGMPPKLQILRTKEDVETLYLY